MKIRTATSVTAAALAAALMLSGCAAGEGTTAPAAGAPAGKWSATTLNVDWATYNPLSLIIKDKGWIEAELGSDVTVNWVQSAGSNKANENLRAGAIDVGSTAGSAALLARSNGSPIKTLSLYSQPEWAAIVVGKDSAVTSVPELKGTTIAATKGTDPYFFLLQTLAEHGLSLDDVEVQNIQHADGKTALETGAVDAWSGLDPLMAASEETAGSRLIYRNIDFNTYGFLNATESFITTSPDLAQVVVNAYEKARAYAIANPQEVVDALAEAAQIDPAIAARVINERTVIDLDPTPGAKQLDVLTIVGPIFVESGDVDSQATIDAALASLFDTQFITKADPDSIG